MKCLLQIITILIAFFFLQGCSITSANKLPEKTKSGTGVIETSGSKKIARSNTSTPSRIINTKNVTADSVVGFAETLIGMKYKYGSAIKQNGFDCSGFITYVFNHYGIVVPRSSIEFTNAGTSIHLDKGKRGDIILFTGIDTTGWVVGHMGIITQNDNGKIKFIYSSSGKSAGVIISELRNYYATRFVKVIRVFN